MELFMKEISHISTVYQFQPLYILQIFQHSCSYSKSDKFNLATKNPRRVFRVSVQVRYLPASPAPH